MPYEYNLENLNRLSQVTESKHIKSLSNAIYPGTHCPLFGATMSCCEVEGLEALVIGTDECTYYTQAFAIDRTQINNNFWSYSMEHSDVVFGSAENVQKAIRTIYEKKSPRAILLITTCVPEIIGEDFDAIAKAMTYELSIPVMTVHTEHFRCNSHISGIENTLTVFSSMMKKQDVIENTINVLGHRFGSIENSELFSQLLSHGYKINLTLPSKCSVEDIEKAPSAILNVVTDFTALPLAIKMGDMFDTPYVLFDKFLHPKRIDKSYAQLGEVLGIDFDCVLEPNKLLLLNKMQTAKARLKGKTFVYGNSVMSAFEVSGFFCELGMKPIIIQARDLYSNDALYIKEILDFGENPYVASIANIAPLRTVYPKLKPNFYIGHENPHDLMKHGILQVIFDAASTKLGYELSIGVIDNLLSAMDGGQNPMLAIMGGAR